MSRLRPECETYRGGQAALPYDTALFLIRDAVERRQALAFGKLHDGKFDCAMGAFWKDNPGAIVYSDLIDEVAQVNDSVPPTSTPKERWAKVRSWLRWKVRVMALKTDG
jgi:hypothetical protein